MDSNGRRRICAALALAGTAALAAPGAAKAAAQAVDTEGKFVVVAQEHKDDHITRTDGTLDAGGDEGFRYFLKRDGALTELRLRGEEPLAPNQRVAVDGVKRDGDILVDDLQAAGAEPAPAPIVGTRSVLIVRVFWNTQDGVTAQQAVNQVGGIDNAYYREASYGQLGLTATATDWFRIPQPSSCDDLAALNTSAVNAATAAGWNTNAFDHLMIYISSADCVGRNWGQIGGRVTWIQGTMNHYRTIHELGHNLGLGHAHSLRCTANGATVPVSSSCASDEYGDLWNVQGYVHAGENTASHEAAPMKDALGWMNGRFQTVTSGTYTLAPLEAGGSSLQALRVKTPTRTYWIEYRQPIGFDGTMSTQGGITGGALVHLLEDPIGSWLVDMRPNTPGDFRDAALPVGASWSDPEGAFKLRVNSAGAGGLNVSVLATNRHWAVVDGTGAVRRSMGLVSSQRLGVGRYELTFNRSMVNCAYTATIGDPGNALVFNPGTVFTAGGHLSGNGVYVETKNLGGGLTDFPFQVFANCVPGSSDINKSAVVLGSGTLVRGGGAVSAARLGTGRYEVTFNRDVTRCAYTATIGDTLNGIQLAPGMVFTAGGHRSVNGVYVETKNPGGGLADYPFHMNVNCSTKTTTNSRYAVVRGPGVLERGRGVTAVSHLGPGRYEVTFNKNVAACSYTATVGDPKNGLVFDPKLVFTAGGHSGPAGVYVETKNLGGGLSDAPFHLSVRC